MLEEELNIWFTKLPVKRQERIACKIMQEKISYPTSTRVWLALKTEVKQKIHDHCVEKHDDVSPEWQDGTPMSY